MKLSHDFIFHIICNYRTQQLPDNSLRIRHTDELDDGVYICTAENIWGTSDAKARLRVSGKMKSLQTFVLGIYHIIINNV